MTWVKTCISDNKNQDSKYQQTRKRTISQKMKYMKSSAFGFKMSFAHMGAEASKGTSVSKTQVLTCDSLSQEALGCR